VGGRTEEAVGGHQPVDTLVWALEVVAVHVERQPSLAVGKPAEDGAAEELLPQRLPEALHLAQGLRVLGPALDMPDPLAAQLALKVRLASPGRILAALVSEHLLGWTV
jgi:hypothetical protein